MWKLIYHTNVIMGLGDGFALIFLDDISGAWNREFVRATILESGKEVIEVSMSQVNNFAGNMLQV